MQLSLMEQDNTKSEKSTSYVIPLNPENRGARLMQMCLTQSHILSPSAIADSNPNILFLILLFQYPVKNLNNEYTYITRYATMEWFKSDTNKSVIRSYISAIDDIWRNRKYSMFVQKPKSNGIGYEESLLENDEPISGIIQSQRGTIFIRLDPVNYI